MKRIAGLILTGALCISSTVAARAEANGDQLGELQQQLQQSDTSIQQKEQEKQAVSAEIQGLQQELQDINSIVAENEAEIARVQQSIKETNELIEQKKEEIIQLEDRVLARKDVMRNRVVSIQENENTHVIVDILINSENLAELLEKMQAVSTLLNADQDILQIQQKDLEQIERDKEIIKQKEELLEADREKLAKQQATLQDNVAKKQQALQAVQAKYNEINNSIALAQQEKANIEAGMKAIEAELARQAAAAAAAAEQAAKAQQEAKAKAQQEANVQQEANAAQTDTAKSPAKEVSGGRELYVTATAYTPYDGPSHEQITAAGYDIGANPNMKLIAVDPNVIKLGTKVWVEGYGHAIAGDTGGKINGHKIDVLLPSKAAAYTWGVKRVKIIVFD